MGRIVSQRERDRGEWIPWYVDDSPGWLELSLAARGAAEGIARKMGPRRGELFLGSRGLKGLATLLRCRWEELEPALNELLAGPHPRLIVSEDQRVLIDPEHESRRRQDSAERMRRKRARDGCDASDVTAVTSEHPPPCDGSDACSRLLSSDLISSSSPEADQDHLTGGSSGDPPPAWFVGVVASVGQTCIVDLHAPECWLRYAGHRESKSEQTGRPIRPSQGDARQWLTAVMVPEARKKVTDAARQRERDKRYADHTPKHEQPTKEQALAFAEELGRRMREDAKKGAA